MCEYDDPNLNWSVANILASTVFRVKRVALIRGISIPEAISECVLAYESTQDQEDSE